mmetsp:Transcript_101006/g.174488  ORF Transcript_101006/g.174488 Transcript_101006/m.174488 type:complete len:215 (-) Transcript_101006:2110-2754(-)
MAHSSPRIQSSLGSPSSWRVPFRALRELSRDPRPSAVCWTSLTRLSGRRIALTNPSGTWTFSGRRLTSGTVWRSGPSHGGSRPSSGTPSTIARRSGRSATWCSSRTCCTGCSTPRSSPTSPLPMTSSTSPSPSCSWRTWGPSSGSWACPFSCAVSGGPSRCGRSSSLPSRSLSTHGGWSCPGCCPGRWCPSCSSTRCGASCPTCWPPASGCWGC